MTMMPIKKILILPIILITALMFVFSMGTMYAADQNEPVIKITAKKFEYSPGSIKIKKGVPVILELTSLDVMHGFNCPKLGVRTDIKPGEISRVRILAQKAGVYGFYCDVFCGSGHEEMNGKIIVED
jgi:cytochrome c oxidase subunit II